MKIAESELILNADGSIYHLNLLPEDIAPTIIFVGDPDRVSKVSDFFDTIRVKKQKREFVTHTGSLNGKELTVISTGIGTDNIDIVLTELDALVNIDFKTRTVKNEKTKLEIIRIGTSGSIQPEIKVGSFLISTHGMGFDNLLHFYQSEEVQIPEIQEAFIKHTDWFIKNSEPYVVEGSLALIKAMRSEQTVEGITGTNVGFYGPQGRQLRLAAQDEGLNDKLASFEFDNIKITNLEMETSAIYGLAKLLGHEAVSMNCILANRANGTFLEDPKAGTKALIEYTLNKIIN